MSKELDPAQPYPALDDLLGRDPEALESLTDQTSDILDAARQCRNILFRIGWPLQQLDSGIAEVQALHDNCVRARELKLRGQP